MTDINTPIPDLVPVGIVVSPHRNRSALPKQGRGSDIEAVLEMRPELEPAWRDITPGGLIWVLTWLHQAERGLLRLHPRGDHSRPVKGVFSLRSPARPNPIGLTLVEVLGVRENRIEVKGLEVLDGTPVLDIKPHVPAVDT